jgi:glucose-6-phosphate isomerase
MATFQPININYQFNPPSFEPYELLIERSLEEMQDVFYDQQAVKNALDKNNPQIVKVWMAPLPDEGGHLMSCMTVIYPGTVGDEYFMTKGHIHTDRVNDPEYYMTIRGKGLLLLQTREGETHVSRMVPGTINYIPSEWAHRTVNTGDDEFVFLGFFPASAKRDYSFIGVGKENFHKVVVKQNEKTEVIDHP